jgi:RNA polymerase sigma-70 factor (ECF subfamily)
MVEDAGRLMARVRSKDPAAFEALYDQYHRLVYGVAMRMLNDVAAAEDVTQAVFLKIWSSPQLFETGNFAGWLVRMTRNRSLDLLRSKSYRHEELPETQPADDMPDEIAFAHINADLVRAALSRLPEEQRQLIELGFFGGLTHEEMSRRTGIPLGTIKTRIRAGLRKLRASLQETVTV